VRGPSSGLGPRPCLDEPAHEARGLLLAHARPRGLPRRHQGRRSPTARAVLPAPRRRRRGGGPRSGPERVRERPQRASWPRERPFVGRDSERRRNTSLARAVRGEKKRGHGGSWPRARACSGGGGGGGGWLARGSSGVGGGCSGEARRSCGRLALPGEEAGPLGGERGEDGGGLGQHGRRRVECGEDLGSEGGGRGAGARGARREGGAHRGHQRRRPTAPLLGRLQPCVGAARSEAARALRVCQAARERGSPLLQRLHDRPRLSHLVQQHRRTYYTFGAAGKQPAPSARLIASALQNSLHSPHLDPPRRSVRLALGELRRRSAVELALQTRPTARATQKPRKGHAAHNRFKANIERLHATPSKTNSELKARAMLVCIAAGTFETSASGGEPLGAPFRRCGEAAVYGCLRRGAS
jgi:hypothetical protein